MDRQGRSPGGPPQPSGPARPCCLTHGWLWERLARAVPADGRRADHKQPRSSSQLSELARPCCLTYGWLWEARPEPCLRTAAELTTNSLAAEYPTCWAKSEGTVSSSLKLLGLGSAATQQQTPCSTRYPKEVFLPQLKINPQRASSAYICGSSSDKTFVSRST